VSQAAKTSVAVSAPVTEKEQKINELQFITELQAAMQRWYAESGPGVDVAWYGIALVVKAADEAAKRLSSEDEKDLACRQEALRVMRGALKIKWPKNLATQRNQRERLLRRGKDPELARAYESKTIALIAEDFPAWYAEVGLWGFVRSLLELVKVAEQVFNETLEDASIPKETLLFMVAFELRRRFGKVDSNLLGALEFLGELEAGKELAT